MTCGMSVATGNLIVEPVDICEFSDNKITGRLYIGKALTDGTVTAMIVGDQLEVTFDLTNTDYSLVETQIWAGTTPPPCNPGNAHGYAIDGELDGALTHTMNVPLPEDLDCGDELYIGAHLETKDKEGGWASFGECIPNCKGKNWAYCMVKKVECDCTCSCIDWLPAV